MRKPTPIRFSDYVKQLPPAIVYERLLKPRGSESRIISSSLIAKLSEKFTTAESATRRFAALPPPARTLCGFAYLCGGAGLGASGLEHARDELLGSFLLYLARDGDGARFYFGFDDLVKPLGRRIAEGILETARAKRAAGKGQSHASPSWLLSDLAVVCALASQGELETTQAGSLTRASSNALARLLHGLPSRCIFESRDADARGVIALLIDYGVERKLLTRHKHGYANTPGQFEQLNGLPRGGRCEDFVDFAVGQRLGWRPQVLRELLEALGGDALSTDVFPEECRERFHAGLRTLCYAGLILASRHGDAVVWQAVTKKAGGAQPRQDAAGALPILLPDFSALLPQETAPRNLYAFSLLGALSSLDRVYKGAIKRESVNNSLSRGIDGDVLLSYLAEWKAPKNVLETVREWVREFVRLFMSSENIIVSTDEKTSRQLRSYQPMSEMIEPLERAHTVFVVKKGREKAARELLVSMGFDPRASHDTHVKDEPEEPLFAKEERDEPTLVLDFSSDDPPALPGMRSGKYGAEMKKLESNEVYHVIEYAILMGHRIRIDYAGGLGTRKGTYTLTPVNVHRGKDSYVEAEFATTGKRRKFDARNIVKIGVLHEGTPGRGKARHRRPAVDGT